VCEANAAVMPRLKDGGSVIRFEASGKAQVSAGPTVRQAAAHLIAGKLDSPRVTLGLATPRGEPITEVYAAAHVRSSSPPSPKITYQIEASFDGGKTWRSVVKDWTVNRQGDEPKDFWSQSMCWGKLLVGEKKGEKGVQVRFANDGGKQYARAEAHLVYELPRRDATRATFSWTDEKGDRTAEHVYPAERDDRGEKAWVVPTGKGVRTKWVELAPVAR
jgi:hypothetical protein